MVEIIAIIRPTKLAETKRRLIEAGYPGYTCQKAMGRGKKPVAFLLADGTKIRTNLVTKRILNIMVPDEGKNEVVKALMDANSTGNPGDGKIFICPVEKSYNVRTRKLTDEV
ncbi:MAG: P-II family nitrogen regulator [Hespellia sp.]|nr:P-II family nitrogen regulator [Hespellia sp.]